MIQLFIFLNYFCFNENFTKSLRNYFRCNSKCLSAWNCLLFQGPSKRFCPGPRWKQTNPAWRILQKKIQVNSSFSNIFYVLKPTWILGDCRFNKPKITLKKVCYWTSEKSFFLVFGNIFLTLWCVFFTLTITAKGPKGLLLFLELNTLKF